MRNMSNVETKAFGAWTDQTLIPLFSDQEGLGFCQFIFEFTPSAETDRMARVSIKAAESVVRASLAIHGTDDFQRSVGDVLEKIMEEAGARGGQILLIDNRRMEVLNFCEKLGEGVSPVHKKGEEVISYDLIQTWEAVIGVSNELIIMNEQDMSQIEKRNPEWARSMRDHRVRSLMLIPLRRSGRVIGYMYIINFDPERLVETKETVELMSFVLGSEIYNYLLLRQLEDLSLKDTLTGLRNRRAMVRCAEHVMKTPGMEFGIVNLDLNGLKLVNDGEGHEAGDRLLVQAGEILSKVFSQDDLFRIGGDEFVVILSGIDRDVFEQKVQRLRKDMAKNTDVSFAIGKYWSDGSTDINTAFEYADNDMYADKKRFYEEHPRSGH